MSIDIALRDWVLQQMMVTKRVSQVEIKQKALELILPHRPDFRASSGWITRFLHRHNISLKGKCLGNDLCTDIIHNLEGRIAYESKFCHPYHVMVYGQLNIVE